MMTMNNILTTLRKKNIRQYKMLVFCTVLSVLLVTSYAMMYFSPTVQNILPDGGDSRKQASMIFAIAIVGCAVFTTYASSLFFKYKSYEYGIFMALGEKKSSLKKFLIKELAIIIPVCSIVGLILSVPASFCIWKLFQIFIVDTKEMVYAFGWLGLVYGGIFCVFVMICIFITGAKFINRSNIIDIINEQRKSEVVRDVNTWVGIVGWILTIGGIVFGYVVPQLSVDLFSYMMPSIWNITFLFSFIGIYMIMLYTIVHIKNGRNSKKYYNNIISFNMMRFSGRQTVKNMCVIALLVGGAMFALLYVPNNIISMLYGVNTSPIDYTFFYKDTEDQVSKDEIYNLAKKHDVAITSYDEMKSIDLITNGISRNYDNDNKISYNYIDKIGYSQFFPESDFSRVSKMGVDVKPGEYKVITLDDRDSDIWNKNDDLNLITDPVTDVSEKMTYGGFVIYPPFVDIFTQKYVLSDEDYYKWFKNLPKKNVYNYVLFNVQYPESTYSFAKELKNEIILRSSPSTAVTTLYDEYEKSLCLAKGENYYGDDYPVNLSVDNNQLFMDWKYYPSFTVLDKQDFIKNVAVFLMLFIYIAIICLVAGGVIAYTRSITIGMDNKAMFDDLKKLGASNKYIERTVRKQLIKIFSYPTIVGSGAMYLFWMMIMYFNDSYISISEIYGLLVNLSIFAVVALFMYVIYRFALRRVKNIIKI